MEVIRWVVFSILSFFGGWATLANWIIPFRKGGGSLIPLLGGLLLTLAFVVAPLDALNSLWWLPLFIDLGCFPLFTMTAGFLIWRAVRKKEEERRE